MIKLQIDPNDKAINNKEYLWCKAQELINDFCLLNNISLPIVEINNTMREHGKYLHKTKNRSEKIIINIKSCRIATITPQYQWSFPAYKSDLTPIGIYAHEFGHYIWENMKNKILIDELQNIVNNEKSITSYDNNNNLHECFAESFKLFITNPDLLKIGRPLRYNFLVQSLGLKTNNTASFYDPFIYAHPRYKNSINNWIKI